jgi:hypothetical protein
MKRILLTLFTGLFLVDVVQAAGSVTYEDGRLDNGIVSVLFKDDGGLSIHDSRTQEALLSDSRFWLERGKRGKISGIDVEDVKDSFGVGKRVVVQVADFNELGYWGGEGRRSANRIYTYALYEESPALICGFGLNLPNYLSLRLHEATPVAGGCLFGGRKIENPLTLNGSAGMDRTMVVPGLNRRSPNSLMLTGLVDHERRSAVWGGLGNEDFGKFTILVEGSPAFYAQDPVGRLVDEEETYLPKDTFYLDVYTRDPFDALERYGRAVRVANNASPNVYDFPVLCGWSVSHISKLPKVNNSASLIGELELANLSGLTKYTKVSLRLEPDKYHGDTEQGWWDDSHMRQFKHLVEPYESIAKWSEGMNSRGGIPYIYMQLGMPSDDFVRKFPQYMLFNDGSEVDRTTAEWVPGRNKRQKHNHHQPYVTFDYTDREFSNHFVKVWSKLREDGIRGVKVDYPETAWRPEGGFDDRYATTNSAYRRAFALLREAFGEDGFIDERNLGESSRPCLDVTAGLVDTQRTWGDANGYAPEMVSIGGLRWYKNRTVFNYYPDTKAVHHCSAGIRQSLLTTMFLTSGRIDLSTSFSLFTPEITHDFSRIYPHYREPYTARPLDAFTGISDPQVYDLELTPEWHQIALYNTSGQKAAISTAISGQRVDNAIGLDPDACYHAYEFWSDTYLGRLPGTARLSRELEPNHCAMISLRKVQPYPQVVSTNRHLLQGWVEMKNVAWDSESRILSGTASVIGGESFQVVVAHNGGEVINFESDQGGASLEAHPVDGMSRLVLTSPENAEVKWKLGYAGGPEEEKHLFILSGQSNMVGLKHEESFTPAVTKAFGEKGVIVVKDAHSGQSIRGWCESNHEFPPPTTGRVPKVRGGLYDLLIKKVKAEMQGVTLESVTFVWMQGESDLNNTAYDAYLTELIKQLQRDLAFRAINLVIGRISDAGLDNEMRLEGRKRIRRMQQDFAESFPRGAWVDTDDLNDRKEGDQVIHDLHYHAAGYRILGDRFAGAAIELIQQKGRKSGQ